MATIKKTIQNLKPGKQYLLTVKPKDVELNVLLDPASAIRFTVSDDLTQPAELGDLTIVGNYKSIMISFNPSNESDLKGYNYQVYLPETIAQSGSTYTIISGSTPYLSGFSSSNVIAVDVPQNTEVANQVNANTGVTTVVTTPKLYFARVQSIDTTGNTSAWTPIVASTATTLIDSAHIENLTASKIIAGTIGAHTITMAGATSIIRSSTFDGVAVGDGSYSNATVGWLINGSGKAYFYDAIIKGSLEIGGTIDIGGNDPTSFHVNIDGDLFSGSGTLANAPFKVLSNGDVTANTITTKSLTLTGNTVMSSNSKIFLGTGVYSNTNTPFYVDSASQFSLGNKLTWDGSTLTVSGNVNITGGNTLTLINNAQTSANNAQNAADDAQDTADDAENTAGDAYTLASTKITAGRAAFDINNNSTTISGNKIRTGSITAENSTSTINLNDGTFSFGSGGISWDGSTLSVIGAITGSSINSSTIFGTTITTGGFTVDANGSVETRNITVKDTFSYRATNGFPVITSGTVAANNLVGPLWAATVTGQTVERIVRYSSLREHKENIEDMSNGLSIVNNLRPRIFSWKMGEIDPVTNEPWTDQAKDLISLNRSYGLIVEEVLETQPELVSLQPPSNELPWDKEGGLFDLNAWKPAMWNTIEIIPILIKAIQELSAKVEELESKLS